MSWLQSQLKVIPKVDQLLGDLVTLSIKLGDSVHHADSVTKILDMKKEWVALKSQITQQAAAVNVSEEQLNNAISANRRELNERCIMAVLLLRSTGSHPSLTLSYHGLFLSLMLPTRKKHSKSTRWWLGHRM